MPCHLDALQHPTPVNFRRLAGELHSVAKQASFSIAFQSDFEGFWGGLGRFLETKMDAQIGFGRLFGDAFLNAFLHRFFVIFGGLRSSKIMLSPKRNANFYKMDVFKNG